MSKIKRSITSQTIAYGYDASRFMALEANVCRHSSWYEALGALTFGSSVVETLQHPRCNGLRGDLEALGRDYRRVGSRASSEKKKIAAT